MTEAVRLLQAGSESRDPQAEPAGASREHSFQGFPGGCPPISFRTEVGSDDEAGI
jgi:hypothetical protein